MNKRTKIYVLLIAVLAIWGTIAYKIISSVNFTQHIVQQHQIVNSFNPTVKEIDTFSIHVVERDPFLGVFPKKKKKNTGITPLSIKKDTIAVPKMQYLGLIKKKESSSQIFVLNINDEQFLVQKGQEIQDVKIVNGDSRKLQVRFKNRTITLPIK